MKLYRLLFTFQGIKNEIKSKQSNLTKVITDKWSSPTVCAGVSSSDHRDNVVGVKRDVSFYL